MCKCKIFLMANTWFSNIVNDSASLHRLINKESYNKPQGSYKNFQGSNPYNIFVAILANRWPHKFILILTLLTKVNSKNVKWDQFWGATKPNNLYLVGFVTMCSKSEVMLTMVNVIW